MPKRNTAEVILEEALNLFSVHGYDGVTVKNIADAVGIRDSSLYKHYKSKQEILEKLLESMGQRLDQVNALYQAPRGDMSALAEQYGTHDVRWLQQLVESIFLFFIQDEYAGKFRRLLMIEQYKNSAAAHMFEAWFMEEALIFQSQLFAAMMQQGYFKQGDPFVAALQFYSPILLLILRHDSNPDQLDEALSLLRCHVKEFSLHYTQPQGASR